MKFSNEMIVTIVLGLVAIALSIYVISLRNDVNMLSTTLHECRKNITSTQIACVEIYDAGVDALELYNQCKVENERLSVIIAELT